VLLSPSFLEAAVASATVILSLSLIFASACHEVIASSVFLFLKYPYDVGQTVVIGQSELYVEHISLLYTTFRRADNVVQTPNVLLDSLWVENISRST
jgi:small-conductance mechanosensitive channel